jgi:[ribosomal protein S18]-alanine N-acetyltransferase
LNKENTTVRIRENADADFEALYRLDQDCYEPGVAYSRGTLRAFLNEPGVFCRIAEETGGPHAGVMLGFLVAQQYKRQGHIITVDVPESHRRRGIASLLLRDAEQKLAEAGVVKISLETSVDNAPAVAFWKKHGYCTCGVLRRYYDGKTDAYQMTKLLPGVSTARN